MSKGRSRKNPRTPKIPKYYDITCSKCGRVLHMRKGGSPKCPICDGGLDPSELLAKKEKRKNFSENP